MRMSRIFYAIDTTTQDGKPYKLAYYTRGLVHDWLHGDRITRNTAIKIATKNRADRAAGYHVYPIDWITEGPEGPCLAPEIDKYLDFILWKGYDTIAKQSIGLLDVSGYIYVDNAGKIAALACEEVPST